MKKFLIMCIAVMSFNLYAKEVNNDNGIIEFFFYGCPHCLHMDNKMKYWRNQNKEVSYEKVPVVFNELMKKAAKHYYVSKMLNIEEEFSHAYYRELNDKNKYISDELAIEVMSNFSKKEAVLKAMKSKMINTKINDAEELAQKHSVLVFPTFIINGGKKLNASNSGGHEGLINEINKIFEK